MNKKIKKAWALAKKAHQGQFYGKKPYTHHLLKVHKILSTVTKDEDILCAALLHDCIEDTKKKKNPVTYNQIKEKFGQRVADLVQEVTKDKSKSKEGEFHIKTKDAFVIKLADMVHNLSGDKEGYFEKKVRAMDQICRELICKNKKARKKENMVFCEKCNKKYAESKCSIFPICSDGFLEEWGIICPKKHRFEVQKEDLRP